MALITYLDQLKHPQWQRRRLEIMQRDAFTCQSCLSTESTLHVHHKLYIKGRMLWEYEDAELITLCKSCHKEMHETDEERKKLFARIPATGPASMEEVLALVAGYVGFATHDEDVGCYSSYSIPAYSVGFLGAFLVDLTRHESGPILKLLSALTLSDDRDVQMRALGAAVAAAESLMNEDSRYRRS